jgi:hypothetical protein
MFEEIPKNINLNIELKSKSITSEKWSEELNKLRVSRQIMNKLVLNYLIIEGYKNAAEKFMRETGISIIYDKDLLEKRMFIRTLIMLGKIDEAINEINDINPEVNYLISMKIILFLIRFWKVILLCILIFKNKN